MTYTDFEGNEQELTKEHIHELTDRMSCHLTNFENNCVDHPAYQVAKGKIDEAFEAMWAAYQQLGEELFKDV